jgi:hypothetical protein
MIHLKNEMGIRWNIGIKGIEGRKGIVESL